jgi:hypothetical protein
MKLKILLKYECTVSKHEDSTVSKHEDSTVCKHEDSTVSKHEDSTVSDFSLYLVYSILFLLNNIMKLLNG